MFLLRGLIFPMCYIPPSMYAYVKNIHGLHSKHTKYADFFVFNVLKHAHKQVNCFIIETK